MAYLIGIHRESHRKSAVYQDKYIRILEYNEIPYVLLDANQHDFWERVGMLSHFIYRWEHYEDEKQLARKIMPVMERQYKIACFPDQATAWHYDDKISQYYLMRAAGFPFTQCWVFWSREAALKWIKEAELPLVAKLKGGAGSKNVQLLESRGKAVKIIRRMFGRGRYPSSIDRNKLSPVREIMHAGGNILRLLRGEALRDTWILEKNYVLFQRYLPENRFDTRVTVIGSRAFAFRRMVRANDFRASGSGVIDYGVKEIDPRCISLAFRVSRAMNFQTMAYDFIFNIQGEPEFCEYSYTFLDHAVYDCPGYWDESMNWHEGHFWPQYFQLVDLLGLPGLKQPEIR